MTARNPAQQEVCDGLLDLGGTRPRFRSDLRADLARALADATASVTERLELVGESLWVNKHVLDGVHGCERRFLAEEGFDGWTATNARGTVAHRAIELVMFMPKPPPPLDAVDAAIDRILEDNAERSPADFLRTASPADLAELRAGASDVVAKFEECFPRLPANWLPRVESDLRYKTPGDTIVLSARPDLALGRAEGDEARVLIVDFKTGREYPSHAGALRYYALVATLRLGVPPFRVATYYLDSATWQHEDVDEGLLQVALRRTIDGVVKLAELRLHEREAAIAPGPACGYCRLRDDCEGPGTLEDLDA